MPYTPSGLPGHWAPTPPGNAPGAVSQWGAMDPFLLASGDQFRPGAPPALGSEAYAAAYNEVREIGSTTSLLRSADQSASATYWVAASGLGPWLRAAIDASEASGNSMIDNATLFARMNVAMVDATVGIFDVKYSFDYWRPVTAIRNGDLDGNAATVQDAGWSSYIVTPPHPSYVSGHSAIASSAAAITRSRRRRPRGAAAPRVLRVPARRAARCRAASTASEAGRPRSLPAGARGA